MQACFDSTAARSWPPAFSGLKTSAALNIIERRIDLDSAGASTEINSPLPNSPFIFSLNQGLYIHRAAQTVSYLEIEWNTMSSRASVPIRGALSDDEKT